MRKALVDRLVESYPNIAIRLDSLDDKEGEAVRLIRKAKRLVSNTSPPNLSDRTWCEYDDCLKGIRFIINNGYSGKYLNYFKGQLAMLEHRERVVLGYGGSSL